MTLQDLALPGQLVAWALILFPLSGVVLAWLVPGPEGVASRARALGLLVDSMLNPLAGVFLGALLAEFFQQRRLRAFYAVLSGLTGLAFVIMAPVFALDAVQLRGTARPELRGLYDLNTVRALALFLFVGGLLLTLAVVLWRRLSRERFARAASGGLVGTATPVRAGA